MYACLKLRPLCGPSCINDSSADFLAAGDTFTRRTGGFHGSVPSIRPRRMFTSAGSAGGRAANFDLLRIRFRKFLRRHSGSGFIQLFSVGILMVSPARKRFP